MVRSTCSTILDLKDHRMIFCINIADTGVFAIPLLKAVTQSTPEITHKATDKDNAENQEEVIDNNNDRTPKARRHSSSSLNQQYPRGDKSNGHSSRDPPESPTWKSRLIDALTLNSSSASASCIIDKQSTLSPQPPRVPPIVTQAIDHLENYGKYTAFSYFIC